MMRRRERAIAVAMLVFLASVALPACREVETETETGYEPSSLEPVKGSTDLVRVKFTAEGAKRTGLQLAPVRRNGEHKIVRYAALIYDPEGRTYVYTSVTPLSFVRKEVEVDRIEGKQVFLTRGPAVGTRVVTVGAAEVYGTELEVASQ